MRIISKFHDYYDSVMVHGQDESCLYLRKTVDYDLRQKNTPALIKDIKDLIDKHSKKPRHEWGNREQNIWRIGTVHTKYSEYKWDTFNILFCGKLYKGISINRTSKSRDITHLFSETAYFYDTESVKAYMEKQSIPNKIIDSIWRKKKTKLLDVVNNYFSAITQPDINWMIANKVICVLDKESADRADTITVNPCLRKMHFYKMFEAYSAFQELDMWVSGTLAYPQNEMVEVADKYKIIGHGFDEKYGFRTRPKAANGQAN